MSKKEELNLQNLSNADLSFTIIGSTRYPSYSPPKARGLSLASEVSSLMSTGLSLAGGESADPILKALVGAGKFLVDNRGPLSVVGKSIIGNKIDTARKLAMGLGLTAGMAKIGLELLKRKLAHSSGGGKEKNEKKDPLRCLNSRSKIVKRSVGPKKNFGKIQDLPTQTPLKQLSLMFPNLERSVLADILLQNDGQLEVTIDQVLSMSIDSKTPFTDEKKEIFKFPFSSPDIPPCPECPVCLTSLAEKNIYQCSNGHHVCQVCRNNPNLRCCPSCRQKLVGRATNMEQFLATLYSKK